MMGKRQPSRIPRAFLCAVLGVASAMCFVVDTEGYVGMSALPAASTSYLWSALALCFALLLHHIVPGVDVIVKFLENIERRTG